MTTPAEEKFTIAFRQFSKAAFRFEQSLTAAPTELHRDAAIQRFEFTMDLAWKTLQAYLEAFKGIKKTSPKDCFRQAYRERLIDYDEVWLHYVDVLNQTSHSYNEETAQTVYQELPQVLKHVKILLDCLTKAARGR